MPIQLPPVLPAPGPDRFVENDPYQGILTAWWAGIAGPTAGNSVLLADLPGGGTVRSIQIISANQDFLSMVFSVYVDKETTPAFSLPIGVLLGANNLDATNGIHLQTTYVEANLSTAFAQWDMEFDFPFPFGDTFRAVLTNPLSHTGALWSTVEYEHDQPAPRRLRSAFVNGVALAAGADGTWVNIPSGAGYLAFQGFVGSSLTGATYLERDVNATTETGTTKWGTGTEDWYRGSFYHFANGRNKWSMTITNPNKISFFIDILSERKGKFRFQNGCVISWPHEAAGVDDVTYSTGIGYYIETAVHGTILPEINNAALFPEFGANGGAIWDFSVPFRTRADFAGTRAVIATGIFARVLDQSGNGNDMPTENDTHQVKLNSGGPGGYWYQGDNSGDGWMHFASADFPAWGDFNVTAILRMTDAVTASNAGVFSGKDTADAVGILPGGGGMRAVFIGDGGSYQVPITVNIPDPTNFHVYTFQRVGSLFSLYQDGVLIGSATVRTNNVRLGQLDRYAGGFQGGSLFRMWQAVMGATLTPTRIAAVHAALKAFFPI